MPSLKKNIIYNFIYQFVIVLLPLITSPYVARNLGAEMMGIYSYTYSIAYYFMMFGRLGIVTYGNRCIAKVRDDKLEMSKEFWSLCVFQIVASMVMICLYIVYLQSSFSKNTLISVIHITAILANMFDITWFFFGIEDFGLALSRNIGVKLASFFMILLFVNSPEDLWIYTLIMGGSTLAGQIVTWPFLFRHVSFVKPTINDVIVHFKPNLILFIPSIAISVFQVMDKIMLGYLSPMSELGYYEYAEKIISVPKSLITALGSAMLPRMSNLVANGKIEKSQRYITNSMYYVSIVSFALSFGLAGVANIFAPVYWGSDFLLCGNLIACLCPAIVFSVIGNVIRTQYLIPNSKDKEYVFSLVGGATINLIGNILMIPTLGALGASISTVLAELLMTVIQLYVVRKQLPLKQYMINGYPFCIIGVIMFSILIILQQKMSATIGTLFTLVLIGGFIYIVLISLYIYFSNNTICITLREEVIIKLQERREKKRINEKFI